MRIRRRCQRASGGIGSSLWRLLRDLATVESMASGSSGIGSSLWRLLRAPRSGHRCRRQQQVASVLPCGGCCEERVGSLMGVTRWWHRFFPVAAVARSQMPSIRAARTSGIGSSLWRLLRAVAVALPERAIVRGIGSSLWRLLRGPGESCPDRWSQGGIGSSLWRLLRVHSRSRESTPCSSGIGSSLWRLLREWAPWARSR